jgi:hypothetical protein
MGTGTEVGGNADHQSTVMAAVPVDVAFPSDTV